MCLKLERSEEWVYLSEGGENAVFAFNPETEERSQTTKQTSNHSLHEFDGYVLRIPKKYLALSAIFLSKFLNYSATRYESEAKHARSIIRQSSSSSADPKKCSEQEGYKMEFGKKSIYSNTKFQREVVQPVLGTQYVDLPVPVELSLRFLSELRHRTLDQRRIPSSRLKDWSIFDEDEINNKFKVKHEVTKITFYGTLHNNHALLPSKSPNHLSKLFVKKSPCIGIEIKPKAGYISRSPLLKPAHRHVKYRYCRFKILQQLMKDGHIYKDWKNKDVSNVDEARFKISEYSPLDFFASSEGASKEEEKHITNALDALFVNPQINLRVWWSSTGTAIDQNIIYGNDIRLSETRSIEILQYLKAHKNSRKNGIKENENFTMNNVQHSFQSCNYVSYDQILKHNMKQIATKIFIKEKKFRERLLNLQKEHDILDADGAIEVYNRLVLICDGSHEKAQAQINDSSSWNYHDLNRSCQEDLLDPSRPNCEALTSLLIEIGKFREKLKTSDEDSENIHARREKKEWVDLAYTQSLQYVSKLNKNACIWLLHKWLISLSMCDVSIFATFCPILETMNRNGSSETGTAWPGPYLGVFDVILLDATEAELSVKDYNSFRVSDLCNYKVSISYQVKVIDCDPKPAVKLAKRGVQEALIALCNINNL